MSMKKAQDVVKKRTVEKHKCAMMRKCRFVGTMKGMRDIFTEEELLLYLCYDNLYHMHFVCDLVLYVLPVLDKNLLV